VERECLRYQLDRRQVEGSLAGEDPLAKEVRARRWWDIPIVFAAVGIFVWLARGAAKPPITMNIMWAGLLVLAMLGLLLGCGTLLWKRTRFS
jgi:hypothetical protein